MTGAPSSILDPMRPLSPTARKARDAHRWLDTGLDRSAQMKERSRLSWEAIAAVVVAVGAVGAGVMLFASLWEDVVEHDGLALRDPSILRWVVDHRSPAMEAVARFVTSLGSVTMLILRPSCSVCSSGGSGNG